MCFTKLINSKKSIAKSLEWRINQLKPVEGWNERVQPFEGHEKFDEEIKQLFLKSKEEDNFARYSSLVKYFLYGFVNYRSKKGAMVHYPGAGGFVGRRSDGLEGFARILPLIAAWINSGNSSELLVYGKTVNLLQLIAEGIVSGVNPQGPEYWGEINDRDQKIVEAADIALSLWLCGDTLWSKFTEIEKKQITHWLLKVKDRDVFSGVAANWELFPIVTLMSLKALGAVGKELDTLIQERFQYYKRHYLGEGWFFDTPDGADYYNAWAVHYSLFWINQIDPEFESNFIKTSHLSFANFYKHLFSNNGFPLMGRSVCYRLAVPSPLLTASLMNSDIISPSLGFRTLDCIWSYFVERGSLKFGTVTQGFCCQNLSVLDKYSGTGSCLWSLRSLIVAMYVGKFASIWNSPFENLPIEKEDFLIRSEAAGWLIKGDSKNQIVHLDIIHNRGNKYFDIVKHGYRNKISEFVLRKPFRPDNSRALYRRPSYSNHLPVVDC